MGANKIGCYLVQYRSKKKDAAEEEKRRKIEDAQRRPQIIDPSFELFGHTTPVSEQWHNDPISHDTPATSPGSINDDWLFQTRRASTLPRDYQFDSYCEVTPKSSVSSQNSAASDATSTNNYEMGWDPASTARPRPQSYLPSSTSATYSHSMADLHRSTEYKSRRQSSHIGHQRQESLPSYSRGEQPQPAYRLEASLTRPFSIDDPLDFLSEPLRDSHLYNQTSQPQDDIRLSSIPEDVGATVSEYTDDLIKRRHRV